MAIYPFGPTDMRYPIKAYIDGSEPSGPVGAFGIPLVAIETPIPRMQIAFPYNINTTQVTTTTANGGTVTQSAGKAVLQTSTANNGSAIMRSRFAARYSPGQGQAVKFTAIFTPGVANSQQEIGIGDLQDGFFFGYVGTTFGIIRRRAGVDTFIPQSSWNGTDPNTGGSSVPTNFNPAQNVGNVYAIRYQWLGFGAIYFFIEDQTTGYQFLVHTIQYASTSNLTSILNPSLPLWTRAVNSGNTTNLTLQSPSMGVYCEGPFNNFGAHFGTGNRKTGITAETNLFTIRNNVTVFGGAANNNRANIHVDFVSGALSGNVDSQIRLVLNATLGGSPSFVDIDTNTSVVSLDTAGTTVTGGREILRMPSTGNQQFIQDISDIEVRLAPGETLTFAASSFGAAAAGNGGLGWREEV
jgi:hypothetical protein